MRHIAIRFAEHVRKSDGCWTWRGANVRGYGQMHVAGVTVLATHVSWWLHRKTQVPKGMCVCHSCDNPSCVRPDHLFLGTQAENLADMVSKGRKFIQPKRTHCKRGHEFTAENTYVTAKGRTCRECQNAPRRKGIRAPYRRKRWVA